MKKFNVSITVDIKEVKNDGATEFFNNSLTYSDVGYETVLGIEAALIESLQKMNGVGVAAAMNMGLGDKLKAFSLN